jgi:hypothetical protein
MSLIFGVGLIVVAIGMLWIGRPAKGEASAPFMRVWIVGQLYAMVAMVSGVAGMALLLSNWPA